MRLFVFCAFAFTLSAADLSGIWNGQTTDQNGDVHDLSFRFVQNGDTLTGKMYGDNESISIADAKIADKQVTFSVTLELNGSITKLIYAGTVDGNEMTLLRQRAKVNAIDPNVKSQNQKVTVKLKRVA
jgi:hypothetical protein